MLSVSPSGSVSFASTSMTTGVFTEVRTVSFRATGGSANGSTVTVTVAVARALAAPDWSSTV